MKALSLHPENAAAVAWGDKLVEYRTWQTKYRGPLLICASAKKTAGFLIKGRQRLFEVDEDLIKPVKWEQEGQVNLSQAREWFDQVYQPLIIANK